MRTAHTAKALLAAALTLALPATAAAARFSWFDDVSQRDSLGQVRTPLAATGETRVGFGIEPYRSFESLRLLEQYGARHGAVGRVPGLSLHGEIASRPTDAYPSEGMLGLGSAAGALFHPADSRLSGFGIKWQHRLDAVSTISISAGYSETPWSAELPSLEVMDTRATLSWRGSWSGAAWQPGLIGSIFIGDEDLREERYEELGRRYYGFALGGELRVARHHTPYFSYRLQRNMTTPVDPAFALSHYYDDEQSQILAGWKWQVQPNWSLHAEARYGVNGAQLDPYSQDRSRIFFGTRFDFR